MAKEEPIAEGGMGQKARVFANRVEIKKNMFKTVTIPIKRIDQVEIQTGTTLIIFVEKEKHRIACGTPGTAQKLRDAILDNM
jgi:hypothetical protein